MTPARVAPSAEVRQLRRRHVVQSGTRVEGGVWQLLQLLVGRSGHGTGHKSAHGSITSIAAVVQVGFSAGRQPSLQQRHIHGGLTFHGEIVLATSCGRILTHVSQGYASGCRRPLTQQRL